MQVPHCNVAITAATEARLVIRGYSHGVTRRRCRLDLTIQSGGALQGERVSIMRSSSYGPLPYLLLPSPKSH